MAIRIGVEAVAVAIGHLNLRPVADRHHESPIGASLAVPPRCRPADPETFVPNRL